MAVANSLTKQNQKPTFSNFLTSDNVRAKINQMVTGKDGGRFITSLISAVSNNPTLADCEHTSILSAAMLGESLKLSPSPQLGQYYLVPFNDKKKNCKVASFQLGYKGYIQLAIRSGYYKKLNVLAIKEGELVKYDALNEEIEVKLIDDEEKRENATTIGYYAMFEYQNGFRKTMYWSIAKMESHADKYSQAFNLEAYRKLKEGKIPADQLWKYSSFWYKDFDGMAYKTMLRQLISKWGIMSIELQNAMEKDMSTLDENGKAQYVDNSSDFIDIPSAPAQTPQIESQEDDPFAPTPNDPATEDQITEVQKKLTSEDYKKFMTDTNNQPTAGQCQDLLDSKK